MTQHTVGIDLGTTNCALAFSNLSDDSGDVIPIPQLTAPGVVEERFLLPSFIYTAKEGEFPASALALPWDKDISYAAGEFARSHGAKVPTRLVASAKSWLSHSSVDRTSALLPWQAPPEVDRISPVEASARYLRHLAVLSVQVCGDRHSLELQPRHHYHRGTLRNAAQMVSHAPVSVQHPPCKSGRFGDVWLTKGY